MSDISGRSRAFALALLFCLLPLSDAFAHCFVGARFLPATLATDDPCVADEMSLPTVAWLKRGARESITSRSRYGSASRFISESISRSDWRSKPCPFDPAAGGDGTGGGFRLVRVLGYAA